MELEDKDIAAESGRRQYQLCRHKFRNLQIPRASAEARSKYYVNVDGRLYERNIAWVLTGKEMIQLTSVSQGGVRGARVGLGSSGDLSDREIEGVVE